VGISLQDAAGLSWIIAARQRVGIMVLRIKFRVSWVVSFLAVSCTSSEGQMACWLVLITLGGRVRGRVMLSPWLIEGVGRETRVRIAVMAKNSVLKSCIVLQC